jgi:TRAP-type C4-dicarboxylate transport system substrate-binding protein
MWQAKRQHPWCRGSGRRAFGARLTGALWCLLLGGLLQALPCGAQTVRPPAPQHLRIVGGLAGVTQYTRFEEPFWTVELLRLSDGRASAEIVPFDRAGIRGQEMLRLVQLGVVPFGTSILNLSSVDDPELGVPDLAGLNPDMATLRRSVAAFRPYLSEMLRKRYGIELLALYAYPAQIAYCAKPLAGIADLRGRRIRVSSATQADWVAALGATPVQTAFTEVVANMRTGNIDCAITGTMSGNTIGLHEVSSHMVGSAVNWGVAAFVANGAAWGALPGELQDLLRRELPRLEQSIWSEADKETREGMACNEGRPSCTSGRKGRMTLVDASAADVARQREILLKHVLPGWLKRCGPQCAQVWNRTVGPTAGVELH